MKKLLYLILFSVISAYASDNIYVYRNDGLFNAFFSADVDSIRFSKIGVDSIEYQDAVTQEFYTKDSIYRIPLNVIDSISIYQPETKYKQNVRLITPDYYPYIKYCHAMTIGFNKDLPSTLEPKVNEILVCLEENEFFEDGFCGRVTDIIKDSTLIAECDSVGFLEIYDQLISLGEYTIESVESTQTKYKISPRSFDAKGEIPLNLDIPIEIGADNVNVSAAFKVGLKFKVITHITPNNQYIECNIVDRESFTCSCSGGIGSSNTKFKVHPTVLKIKQPIPQLPGFFVGVRFCPFNEWKVSGNTEIEAEGYSQNSHTFIFNNGKFANSSIKGAYDLDFSHSLKLDGHVWFGLYDRIEVSSIGNLVSVGSNISIGPYINANICDLNSVLNKESAYEILKDTKVTACLKGGLDFSFNFKWKAQRQNGIFSSFEEYSIPFGNFKPSVELGNSEFYLLPSFNNLESQITGRSIKALATANRSLLFPCYIGFSLTDEEGESNYKYNNDTYLLEGSSNNTINQAFDNLRYNTNYTLQPVVNIMGVDVKASPKKSVSVGAYVETGSSNASFSSATTICYFSLDDDFQANNELTSYGVCYSKMNTNPNVNSGIVSAGIPNGDHWFVNELTSLEEGTTYYYKGFILIGEQYIYGDTRCFTTKKQDDLDYNDNPGGSIDNGTSPIATTMGSYNVKQNSAYIKLSYSNIIPGTECGYILDSEYSSTSGGICKMISLGTVTGSVSVPLTGLEPSTTYYYQAYARNEYGKTTGRELSFTTGPEPIPQVRTISVYDITQNSAKIKCEYSNLPDEKRGGVEVTSNGWSYAMYQGISDGIKTFSISNLQPATSYSVCSFADYSEGTVYGNDISFTTKQREIPDLSGTWTFSQGYLGEKIVYPELKLKSKDANSVTYRATGFYGVIIFNMTVYTDLSATIVLDADPNGSGTFYGKFDEDFTAISGSSFIYAWPDADWIMIPQEFSEPWSLSR